MDGLDLGIWNVTIWANDSYGHEATVTVWVTVVPASAGDVTAPVISALADITYEEGTSGHWLNWTVTDANPNEFNISKDGMVLFGRDWTSGTPITYNVSGLTPGVHIYRLTAWDQANNSQFDEVTVTVFYPASSYTITVLQPNGGEIISGSYTIKWTATGPAGEALTFNIEYSQDNGANWAGFTSGLTAQQYVWDTNSSSVWTDGSNYLIRVAIAGTTVSDTSDSTFIISNGVVGPPPSSTPGSSEEPPPASSEGEPPTASSPGFELLIGIMSLVAVTMLVRRKRRHY